jgi:hypothetical protein
LQRVPAAYRVAAYYYLGRTELNSDNIAGGIDMLQAAFRECKADSENVKHILRALVPVRRNIYILWRHFSAPSITACSHGCVYMV